MTLGRPLDVAVIGAGPAGLSVAIALAKAGYRIGIFDRDRGKRRRSGEVLSAKARLSMEALGIWKHFNDLCPLQPQGQVALWGERRTYEMPDLFHTYGTSWHVDRELFDNMMRKAARHAGAVGFRVCGLKDIARVGDRWHLRFHGGSKAAAHFVVDATGRSRVFARKAGAVCIRDDDLIGLLCSLPTTDIGQSRLLIESAPHGWWSAIPLQDGRTVVAFMTDPDTARLHDLMYPTGWLGCLERTSLVKHLVSYSGECPKPSVLLATSGHIVPSKETSWIAVGDAAASYDPLTGSGVTHSMHDGLRAAEAIAALFNGNRRELKWHKKAQQLRYQRYLSERRDYYRQEQRWLASSFWQKRHAGHKHRYNQATVSF